MNLTANKVETFIAEQIAEWPMAAGNFAALANVKVKSFDVDGFPVKVQFNPGRIASSGAKVDAASLKARKCFLCAENRPEVQRGLPWADRYIILINPFPIFPRHLTIPDTSHTDQLISGRIADMIGLAGLLSDYTVFYNGPKCGASAPDHMHFQAGNSDFLTVGPRLEEEPLVEIASEGTSQLMMTTTTPYGMFVIDADSPEEGQRLFGRLYATLPVPEGENEPMMNILAYATGRGVRVVVIPRKRHRPSFYGTEGDDAMLISPASVDMGGVFITPRPEDFERIDADTIRRIYAELCLSQEDLNAIAEALKAPQQPNVQVGIMSEKELSVELLSDYNNVQTQSLVKGEQTFAITANGKIAWQGKEWDELLFLPTSEDSCYDVHNVTIGVNFHWERRETQRFLGQLRIIVEGEKLTLVNILPVEDYLASVISSEMSATAYPEFLKAHAVISRSWLLAQIVKGKKIADANEEYTSMVVTDSEIVRWYDREDHVNFDVCADDHCQRYQGITRQTTPKVQEAINATRGMVLKDNDGELCDARFSKSCGGVFEEFETCWEPKHYTYLSATRDSLDEKNFPNLRLEPEADKWIRTRPEAYCNTTSREILSQVLNDYDQETTDFYRWTVHYTQEELAELIAKRSGIDFGGIVALEPVERGTSARLLKLRIVGTKKTMIIGKELEIRRTLSPSHLYSSAFVVEAGEKDENGLPKEFTLLGAGWGHGVGLCQIGAAVMGANGATFRQILEHYFQGAKLETLY